MERWSKGMKKKLKGKEWRKKEFWSVIMSEWSNIIMCRAVIELGMLRPLAHPIHMFWQILTCWGQNREEWDHGSNETWMEKTLRDKSHQEHIKWTLETTSSSNTVHSVMLHQWCYSFMISAQVWGICLSPLPHFPSPVFFILSLPRRTS